jgi:hypothetical protein
VSPHVSAVEATHQATDEATHRPTIRVSHVATQRGAFWATDDDSQLAALRPAVLATHAQALVAAIETTHKATDELYSKINDNVDTFVEVLLGKCGNRVHLGHVKHISLKDFNHVEEFKREMENFKSYLIGLNSNKGLQLMSNSDLYNIRDELLANVNQFLYLLTFK